MNKAIYYLFSSKKRNLNTKFSKMYGKCFEKQGVKLYQF